MKSKRKNIRYEGMVNEKRFFEENSSFIFYRILLKPEQKFDFVSASVTAISGYTPEEHYSNPQLGYQLVHPDDLGLLENAAKNNSGNPLQLRWIRKDGQVIWTEHRLVFILDDLGEPCAMEGTALDITYQKNVEDRLRRETEKNDMLFDLFAKAPLLSDKELYDNALDIAVKITGSLIGFFHEVSDDQQGIILTTWNAEAQKTCKAEYNSHYPLSMAGMWADSVRQKIPLVCNDYAGSSGRKGLPEGHATVNRIMTCPVLEGDVVRLIFGVGNKSADYTGLDLLLLESIGREMHKILGKRKVEKELKRSEERWHFAVEGSSDGIWDWNLVTNEVYYSSRWKEIIGWGPEELAPDISAWETRIHPDDRTTVWSKLSKHFNRETQDYSSEHRLKCRDGSWKWILDRGKVLEWSSDGKPARMVGTHTDISERKATENLLKESEERYRNLSNSGSALIWTSGVDKLCDYFNEPWLNFTGRTLEQELGNGWAEGVHADDLPRCLDIYTGSFDRRESFEMEYRLKFRDGSYRWLLDRGAPRFDAEGNFIGYLGYCYDIHTKKSWRSH